MTTMTENDRMMRQYTNWKLSQLNKVQNEIKKQQKEFEDKFNEARLRVPSELAARVCSLTLRGRTKEANQIIESVAAKLELDPSKEMFAKQFAKFLGEMVAAEPRLSMSYRR